MELPEDAPQPRYCHLIKWPDFDGYGFNLHAEKSKTGQYIGKVDDDSPAKMAGLREGDRILEVNGVNIANENHRQVVERIKSIPNETKLLVLDEAADRWYKERKIIVKSGQANVINIKTPVPRPSSTNESPPPTPPAKINGEKTDPVEEEKTSAVNELSAVNEVNGNDSTDNNNINNNNVNGTSAPQESSVPVSV